MSEPGALLDISPSPTGWVLVGEIDAHTAPSLAAALEPLPAGDVVLDVAGVTFLDSSGLRVLLGLSRAARQAGHAVVLLTPSAAVRRVVDISGVGEHLVLRD